MPDPQSTADTHELPDALPDGEAQRVQRAFDIAREQAAQEPEPPMPSKVAAQSRIAQAVVDIRNDLDVLHGYGLDPRCKATALTKLDEMVMWTEKGW